MTLLVRTLAAAAVLLAATAPAANAQVNTTQSGTYGQVSLNTGFEPDPHSVTVTAGGGLDASTINSDCTGHIAARADYTLRYRAGTLPLIISTTSQTDTTLAVRTPGGQWVCNDDGGQDLNAIVRIDHPTSGRYQIWVGTFGTDNAPATLNISEIGAPGQNAGGGSLDVSANPTYGTVALTSGFNPDPYNADVTAGGGIDPSSLGQNCVGRVAGPPDYRLNWTAGNGSLPLIISATSESDTTLVINDAQGNWVCNDDGEGQGLNPVVRFDHPTSGQYDIWVGTFGEATAPAVLHVSELTAGGGQSGSADPSLDPTYGAVSLHSGFHPDPYTHAITAGGDIGASSVNQQCSGYIARAPDFRVNWTAGSGSLPLIFSVASSADTTLVINDAQGNWLCDDDGGVNGMNPAITIQHPPSGQYDIWVGSYAQGQNPPSTLNVSELHSQ